MGKQGLLKVKAVTCMRRKGVERICGGTTRTLSLSSCSMAMGRHSSSPVGAVDVSPGGDQPIPLIPIDRSCTTPVAWTVPKVPTKLLYNSRSYNLKRE